MSGFAGLMEALRSTGLQDLAPVLMRTSIRCFSDLELKSGEALSQGITPDQLLRIQAKPSDQTAPNQALEPLVTKRWDHPPVQRRSNASMSDALAAALVDGPTAWW